MDITLAFLILTYNCQEHRGKAIGFFTWGLFMGFSLSFVLINVEERYGWRMVYFISGVPGVVLGVIMLFTVKEPTRGGQKGSVDVSIFQTYSYCLVELTLL